MNSQATDYIKKLYLAKVSPANIIKFVQVAYPKETESDIADIILNYHALAKGANNAQKSR